MQAIILAGGKGRRLAPYTSILPKPLVPIGDMPIVEVLMRQLKRSGVKDVTLAVGYLAALLQAYFGDGSRLGIHVAYSLETQPLGTVGPLALLPRPKEPFFVMNGDVLTTLDFRALYDYHCREGGIATIAMQSRRTKIDLGVIRHNGENRITDYIEKPTQVYSVSMGVYVFDPAILDHIPLNQYLDFPTLVKQLLGKGKTVVAYPFTGYWADLGRPDDYETAAAEFESMREQFLGPEEPREQPAIEWLHE